MNFNVDYEESFAFANKYFVLTRAEIFDSQGKLMDSGRTRKKSFYLQKQVDCNCFGMRCPPYRTICTSGHTRAKMTFTPGKEFTELVDGNFGRSTITFEGNKMIHAHKGKKDIVTTREFMGSNMIMITRADQIITKVQYFEEQPNHGRK